MLRSRTLRGAALGSFVLGGLLVASAQPAVASTFTFGTGDTLYTVAQRNGISPWQLQQANPQLPGGQLLYGDRVVLPRNMAQLVIAAVTSNGAGSLPNAFPVAALPSPSNPQPNFLQSLATATLGNLGRTGRTIQQVSQVVNLAQQIGLLPRSPITDLARILSGGGANLAGLPRVPGLSLPTSVPGASLPTVPGVSLPQVAGGALPQVVSGSLGGTLASNAASSTVGTQVTPAGNTAATQGAAQTTPSSTVAANNGATGGAKNAAGAQQAAEDPDALGDRDPPPAGASSAGEAAIQAIRSGQLVNPNTGNRNWSTWCLALVRVAFQRATGRNIPELSMGSAVNAFRAFQREGLVQRGDPPRGALVFWSPAERGRISPGSAGAIHGHVAISNGNGTVISNVRRNGPLDPNGDGIGIAVPIRTFGNPEGYVIVRPR